MKELLLKEIMEFLSKKLEIRAREDQLRDPMNPEYRTEYSRENSELKNEKPEQEENYSPKMNY